MLRKVLAEIYERDLDKLKAEMDAFSDEADLWKTAEGITNSAGTLCLHLTGNLQHFFGAVLGDSGYVRYRDAEFALRNVPRSEMIADIEDAKEIVLATLAGLTEDDLDKPYPVEVFGHPMTTGYFLTHLSTHFNYHLGQVNYHRRLLASGRK
jgi:uncharacterized damage-inducible protein DinB